MHSVQKRLTLHVLRAEGRAVWAVHALQRQVGGQCGRLSTPGCPVRCNQGMCIQVAKAREPCKPPAAHARLRLPRQGQAQAAQSTAIFFLQTLACTFLHTLSARNLSAHTCLVHEVQDVGGHQRVGGRFQHAQQRQDVVCSEGKGRAANSEAVHPAAKLPAHVHASRPLADGPSAWRLKT